MIREQASPVFPEDFLQGYDFARHNAGLQPLWDAYNSGKPFRTPVVLGLNSRYFLDREDANPGRVGFRQYSEDPDVMFETQLQFQRWSKHNLLVDYELGLPAKWPVYVDFQNYSEAAWFGCPVEYLGDQVPDTRPIYADSPEKVMERGIPNPFEGIYARGLEYYEHFKQRAANEMFYGRLIEVSPPFTGSDGVMTVACNLFGPDFVCTAMASEPERLQRLFEFISKATLAKIQAWRKMTGLPGKQDGCWYADDSIALISKSMYREHVLPWHREFYEACTTEVQRAIHLCGDATRHFSTLAQELGIWNFDTGFPVDFGKLRKELGTGISIMGGPHVELLRTASPEGVRMECQRILESGILDGGLFVLREGNNLAPGTPVENVAALYQAASEFGIQGNAEEVGGAMAQSSPDSGQSLCLAALPQSASPRTQQKS